MQEFIVMVIQQIAFWIAVILFWIWVDGGFKRTKGNNEEESVEDKKSLPDNYEFKLDDKWLKEITKESKKKQN